MKLFWKVHYYQRFGNRQGTSLKRSRGAWGKISEKKPWTDTMRTEATFSRCTRLVLNSLLTSLRSRRLEVVGTRKNGCARRRHPLRVSLARARSLFRPLLPSACYAGYLLTSCFFLCVSSRNVTCSTVSLDCWNIAFLCHDSYWRHTSASKDTNLLPLPCKLLDAWLGWLRKLIVVPSPEADVVSSISSFELSALALKWSTYNYLAVTTTQWNLCFLHSYWLFFSFFFSWRSQR